MDTGQSRLDIFQIFKSSKYDSHSDERWASMQNGGTTDISPRQQQTDIDGQTKVLCYFGFLLTHIRGARLTPYDNLPHLPIPDFTGTGNDPITQNNSVQSTSKADQTKAVRGSSQNQV